MNIYIQKFGILQEYVICNPETGESLSILPEYGANLHKLVLRKNKELFTIINSANTDAEIFENKYYSSAILFPWPNRIIDGKYHFKGLDYHLTINEPELNNAIHGLVFDKKFEVISQFSNSEFATLQLCYDYQGDNFGYPFAFKLAVEYKLSLDTGFSMKFTIENRSQVELPFGLGWHPYFQIEGDSTEDWEIQIPATHKFISNERMIPVKKESIIANTLINLKETTINNVFLLEKNNYDLINLHSFKSDLNLIFWQQAGDKQFNYSIIYVLPEYNRIAIEPLTCNTNAFNSGDGLNLLAAGAMYEIECGIYLD